ncbi:MAG: hypothetical protein QOG31_851 [Thermoplasmata archaeon]|nr:hypothetical protein [Thermoplasmata archaeon]
MPNLLASLRAPKGLEGARLRVAQALRAIGVASAVSLLLCTVNFALGFTPVRKEMLAQAAASGPVTESSFTGILAAGFAFTFAVSLLWLWWAGRVAQAWAAGSRSGWSQSLALGIVAIAYAALDLAGAAAVGFSTSPILVTLQLVGLPVQVAYLVGGLVILAQRGKSRASFPV